MNSLRNIVKGFSRVAAAGIFALCLPGVIFSVTLDDFKRRVDDVAATAAEVELLDSIDDRDQENWRLLVERIRREFPPSENVEWSGGMVEVSNSWLLEKARAVEQESDMKKRQPIVSSIREYLSAVSFKLNELDRISSDGRTKDEDKQKLAEILRREEYQEAQQAGESVFQRWLREILEWLANLWPKPQVPSGGFSGMESFVYVMRILLYIGLAAVIGFLIFKVVPLLFPNLKRTAKLKKENRVILGEHIAENENASDLFREADRLAREGNLRGAIRKGYIALLCDLSDRKVIGLARHKTNRDYLRDVRTRRELHPRMKVVTETFERHWYGFQESGEQDWTRFRDEYDQAIRNI